VGWAFQKRVFLNPGLIHIYTKWLSPTKGPKQLVGVDYSWWLRTTTFSNCNLLLQPRTETSLTTDPSLEIRQRQSCQWLTWYEPPCNYTIAFIHFTSWPSHCEHFTASLSLVWEMTYSTQIVWLFVSYCICRIKDVLTSWPWSALEHLTFICREEGNPHVLFSINFEVCTTSYYKWRPCGLHLWPSGLTNRPHITYNNSNLCINSKL